MSGKQRKKQSIQQKLSVKQLSFPFPKNPVIVKFYGHNRKNELLKKFEYRIDPENYFIKTERVAEYKNFEVIKFR